MTSSQAKSKSAGIDLGTTNSLIAIIEGGQTSLVPNADGTCLTPSVVCYSSTPGEEVIVGGLAKRQTIANSSNTFSSVKRLMGLKFSDLAPDFLERIPYTILPDDNNNIRLKCMALNKLLSPEEVSAEILKALVADATAYLGEPVQNVVITVPAYFSESQRRATLDAAKIANISVEQLLNEPTSAGLAYGLDPAVRPDLDRSKAVPETALFFDLGGGTFDVSLMDLDIANGLVEVRSTSGDCFLGGDDFSALLSADITKATIETVGAETAALPRTMQRINDKAEIAKLALSTSEEVTINMPYITQSHPTCEATLTRARFEEQMAPLMDRLTTTTNEVLESASDNKPTFLVLVGGSTRIPAVRRFAAGILDKEPYSPGNPDELVARGAAIQAGLKNGELDTSVVLTDITPLTLGVEQATGIVTPIISRGAGLPALGEESFCLVGSPGVGNAVVPVRVIQGERPNAADPGNRLVGVLDLPMSENARPGEPSILVKFSLDASAVLTVTATDVTVMREVTAVFSDTANLTQSELDDLVKVAEQNAPEDRAKAAIQAAIGNATYLCTEIKDECAKSDPIQPATLDALLAKVSTCISAIERALDQGITKITPEKQPTWRDKCSQAIALLNDAEREIKERQNPS